MISRFFPIARESNSTAMPNSPSLAGFPKLTVGSVKAPSCKEILPANGLESSPTGKHRAAGVGITLLLFDFIFIFPGHAALGEEYWFGSSDKLLTAALTTTFAGAGTFALGRVIQAILPLSYGSRYNKTLREGLGLGKKMEDTFIFEVGAAPTMEGGVLLTARVAF